MELEQRRELRREAIGIEEILHPDRAAGDLVFVRRADAAARGADLGVAHRAFARLVECHVIGEHERAGRRDLEPRPHRHACAFELADLLQQRRRRHHDAVADVDRDARAQDARRNQPQHGLLAVDDERVSGVVSALEPHDALRVLGQPVDDLALAFIAPLGADDDDVLAHALASWMAVDRLRAAPRHSCRFAQHDARELPQVEREAGGGPRAPERLADAVVAAAVADRARLARGEHREDRAVLVMISSQVGEIDVERFDVRLRGLRERRQATTAHCGSRACRGASPAPRPARPAPGRRAPATR